MPVLGPLIGLGTSLIGGLINGKAPSGNQAGAIDETTTKTPNVPQWLSDYIQQGVTGTNPVFRNQVSQGYNNTANVFKQGGQIANASLNHSGFGGAPSGIQAALMNEVTNRAGQAESTYSSNIINADQNRRQALALGALPTLTGDTTTQTGYNLTAGGIQPSSNPFSSALSAAGGILGGLVPLKTTARLGLT